MSEPAREPQPDEQPAPEPEPVVPVVPVRARIVAEATVTHPDGSTG